jgi:cytochrome P450
MAPDQFLWKAWLSRIVRPFFGKGSPGREALDFPITGFSDLERLQRQGPVHQLPGDNVWQVVSHAAVTSALADPATFSSRPQAAIDAALLGADPPRHGQVRRFVATYFSAEAQASLLAGFDDVAAGLMEPRFDAVSGYAVPLANWVGSRLIGIEADAFVAVKEAVQARHAGRPPSTSIDLDAALRGTSLFRRFLTEASGPLTESEAASLVSLLTTASTETAERLIARAILILLQREDVKRKVVSRPLLLPAFVEEVLRLYPPEPVILRETARATQIGGTGLPAGARIRLSVAAANRDPTEFETPHDLRLDRTKNRHFAFGGGSHQCIGAGIARRMASVSLSVLLREAPNLRAAEPSGSLDYEIVGERILPKRLIVDA